MKKVNKIGQSVVEYFLIMCMVLAAILSSGFVDKVRNAFYAYFAKAESGLGY